MVEAPAAAVLADRLVEISDFLSVGTNDLTQYTLVVDRGNARLADRFTPHDPSVLRLLKLVAEAARGANKPASVCGEMASEPLSAFLLLGLGYDTLSVAPPALPVIKWLIRQVTTAQARAAAEAALAARSAELALDILRFALAEAVDLTLLDPDARFPAGRRSGSLKLYGTKNIPTHRHLFNYESDTEGHPDKIADQISDAVLEAILLEDSQARVA